MEELAHETFEEPKVSAHPEPLIQMTLIYLEVQWGGVEGERDETPLSAMRKSLSQSIHCSLNPWER